MLFASTTRCGTRSCGCGDDDVRSPSLTVVNLQIVVRERLSRLVRRPVHAVACRARRLPARPPAVRPQRLECVPPSAIRAPATALTPDRSRDQPLATWPSWTRPVCLVSPRSRPPRSCRGGHTARRPSGSSAISPRVVQRKSACPHHRGAVRARPRAPGARRGRRGEATGALPARGCRSGLSGLTLPADPPWPRHA
jgi:hypothetical protein